MLADRASSTYLHDLGLAADPSMSKEKSEGGSKHGLYPGGGGGRPPARPLVIREIRNVHKSAVHGLAVSEQYNLIATCGSDCTVRVLDYFSLLLRGVYALPKLLGQRDHLASTTTMH